MIWGEETAALLLRQGSKDGEFAYYDSKIVPKAPGLGERDILAESIET